MEDAYTYYVLVLGISEALFWRAELSALASISANKSAYEGWLSGERARIADQTQRR